MANETRKPKLFLFFISRYFKKICLILLALGRCGMRHLRLPPPFPLWQEIFQVNRLPPPLLPDYLYLLSLAAALAWLPLLPPVVAAEWLACLPQAAAAAAWRRRRRKTSTRAVGSARHRYEGTLKRPVTAECYSSSGGSAHFHLLYVT